LVAYWEVDGNPISYNYTPDEIDAEELLRLSAARADVQFPNGLVPISWFAACDERDVFEAMPFRYSHFPEATGEDFLTFYHLAYYERSADGGRSLGRGDQGLQRPRPAKG
jgi:hypothetical protein